MLKNLRIKLTLICVITTGILLMVMTISILWTSEIQLNKQSDAAFQNTVNSIVYKVQSTRTVEDTWLSQLETGNDLILHIEDGGLPLFFSGSWSPKTDRDILIQEAQQKALQEYKIDVKKKPYSIIDVTSASFSLRGTEGDHYQAATVIIPSDFSWYSLTILQNTDGAIQQKMVMRYLYGFLIVSALALLFLFSWWFSGKAIAPIEKNRKEQVEFVAVASHELRSPLAVIRTVTSALSVSSSPKEFEKFHNTLERECVRMSRLVDDLLFLASADAHTRSIKMERIAVDTLLTELYDSYYDLAQNKKQKLSLALPDTLLPTLQGDRQRLWQLISILLDNAISYTGENGCISIGVEVQKHKLCISVSDNGIGIPNEQKQKVFDRFHRVDTAHSQKEHYGLGLSIAKEIAELHHGDILLADTPGGGCTVLIRLEVDRS